MENKRNPDRVQRSAGKQRCKAGQRTPNLAPLGRVDPDVNSINIYMTSVFLEEFLYWVMGVRIRK